MEELKPWTPDIDLGTVPTDLIRAENSRRMAEIIAARNSGRNLIQCPECRRFPLKEPHGENCKYAAKLASRILRKVKTMRRTATY